MKLVTYEADSGPRAALLVDDAIVDVQAADASLPASVKELLALDDVDSRCAGLAGQADQLPLESVKLLPPVPDPQKIICVGANYADHAAESNMRVPAEPIIFSKFATALCAPGGTIELPKVGANVDYEAELVVVIGKPGRNIPRGSAMDHVAGYCCGHDVSARDWQKGKPGGQWTLGKGFDTFAPLGPFLATAAEVGDPNNLRIRLRLNGETMQDSNTQQLIFKIDFLIEYVSAVCTLLPGDLLFTGTPAGVGAARTPPVFLKDGDEVEVEIEQLGLLRNTVSRQP